MELKCARAGRGNIDKIVKAGNGDAGTTIVTKSSKTGSSVCGRIGDGLSLPVLCDLLHASHLHLLGRPIVVLVMTYLTVTASRLGGASS
jgi:hypothetical protein